MARYQYMCTCVLNDYGKCDVKKVSLERKGIDYFTSGKDHYCKGTDPACRQCLINGAADSPVCRGADGCVCLAWCFHELPTSPSTTPTPYPTLPDNYESYFKKKNANKSSSLPYMMTSIFILCGIIMYGMHRLRRFRRVNESPPANASNSSQPPHSTRPSRPIRPARPAQPNELRLTGWQKMRKSLIDHEHAALGIDQAAPAQGRVIRTTSVPVAYGERAHPQEQSTRAAL
ncbi:TPA: hypothetical protein N0F65_008914 [Lagenidium giganteum]|uniref:Uncharacterized protein n=1 Tax=Lagenidium giganteum TaxID=4803 RepID=A0AAV2YSY6_9STRA|nr:TPA: hypothetical protein N0F65_008914 [Lagenidium giganteum]